MTSPTYLRDLATRIRSKATPAARATAERLLEIAGELDHLQAGGTVVAPTTQHADRSDLTLGTNRKLADIRAAQAAAPTPEEMQAIRELVQSSRAK